MRQAILNEQIRRSSKKVRVSKSICNGYVVLENKVLNLLLLSLRVKYLNDLSCLFSSTYDCLIKSLPCIYYSNDVLKFLEAMLLPHHDKVFIKKHLVKILFFISCVYFYRIVSYKKPGEFVNIPYKLLAGVIGQRHFPKVLEILIETKVIECDNHFEYYGPKGKGCEQKKRETKWKPGKAYGYRLNDRFRDSKFKAMPTHLKIGRHMLKFKTEDQKHLVDSMNRAELPTEIAQELVVESDKTERAKELQFHLINQFKNKQFFQSISQKTGRVFNNISSFQRDIRCLIRLDGEETTEIDISGSQPLLLNNFYKYDCKEARKFKELTESGRFYEVLAQETGLDHLPKREFKNEVYKVLFGPMRWNYKEQIRVWFKNNYPLLWLEIEKLKLLHHSEVPIELQKTEAQVVINGVVRKFRENCLPVLTVHDSFIVRRRDAEFLKTTIVQQFQDMYGLTPRLKEEEKFRQADPYWEIFEELRKNTTKEERLKRWEKYSDNLPAYEYYS